MNKVLFACLLVILAILTQSGLVSADSSVWKAKEAEIMKLDFYSMLSVTRETDMKGLKKAFRMASIKNHPDKSTDDDDKAYRESIYPRYVLANDVLTNEKKRRSYDHLLEIGKRPEKITDNDIDTAWSEERNMWVSDFNWAPLDDWQALFLIFGVTIAGFAIPFYNKKQEEKNKKIRAEKARNDSLKHLQNVATKGKEVFQSDATLQKKLSESVEAAAKPIEKKVKKVAKVVEQVVDKSKLEKEEKIKARHDKLKTTATMLLSGLSIAKTNQTDSQMSKIQDELKNYGEVVPPSVKVAVGIFQTAFGSEEIAVLVKELPMNKLENLVNSLCGTCGQTINPTIEEACKGADGKKYAKLFDDAKLRNSLVTVYRLLADLKYKQFPAIMSMSK